MNERLCILQSEKKKLATLNSHTHIYTKCGCVLNQKRSTARRVNLESDKR